MTGLLLRIVGIALVFALGACGQKGPLQLPQPPAAPQSQAPSSAPAERPASRAPGAVPSTSETR